MALKVKKNDPPVVLLQKAMEKWKAYFSNCYDENEDYVLLLEDFKEATFLPGSTKEFQTHHAVPVYSNGFQIGRR